VSKERRKAMQEKSKKLHNQLEQMKKAHCDKGDSTRMENTIISPNMPGGKEGLGIESFSSLANPKASPISNYFCRGYNHL